MPRPALSLKNNDYSGDDDDEDDDHDDGDDIFNCILMVMIFESR